MQAAFLNWLFIKRLTKAFTYISLTYDLCALKHVL
jgi:hypothetical protein